MAHRITSFYHGGHVGVPNALQRWLIEATAVSGQLYVRNANAATAGEIEDPTTTAAPGDRVAALALLTFACGSMAPVATTEDSWGARSR